MQKYEVKKNLSAKEIADLINSGSKLVSVTYDSLNRKEFHFISEIYATLPKTKKEDTINFTKKQAMKLIVCLHNAIYEIDEVIDEEDNSPNTKEKQLKLIELNHELTWDIAEHYGLDTNEGTIDVETLKFVNYFKNK